MPQNDNLKQRLLSILIRAIGYQFTIWPAPERKPNLVTVGESFVGLIMPVKLEARVP